MSDHPHYSARPFLENWLLRQQITDPLKRRDILQHYETWAATPRHQVYSTTSPKANESDLVLLSERDPAGEKARYTCLSLNRKRAVLALCHLDRAAVAEKGWSPLQIGARVNRDSDVLEYGKYEFETWEGQRRYNANLIMRPARAHSRQLISEIAQIAGLPKVPDYWGNKNQSRYGGLHSALTREEGRRIRKAYHQFVRGMDQAALKVMRHAGVNDMWSYRWLTGECDWNDYDANGASRKPAAASPKAQQYRQEAVTAFPGLLFAMRNSLQITKALDAGQPLVQSLVDGLNWRCGSDDFHVTPEMIKSLRGKRPHEFDPKFKGYFRFGSNEKFAAEMHSHLGFVGQFPRQWRPQQPADWQNFNNLRYGYNEWEKLNGRTPKQFAQDIAALLHTKGQERPVVLATQQSGAHVAPASALKQALADSREPYKLRQLEKRFLPTGRVSPAFLSMAGSRYFDGAFYKLDQEHKDFLQRCNDQIAIPAIVQLAAAQGANWIELLGEYNRWDCSGWPTGQVMRRLFNNIGLSAIHTASRRWHRQAGTMERLVKRYNEDASWPRLFNPVIAPDGVRLRCLYSSRQLIKEGSEQANCVGGYTYACMFEGSHIISITAPDNSWRTTLELKASGHQVTRAQHELPGNSKALPLAAEQAEEWLIRSVNNREIPVNWEVLDVTQKLNQQRMEKFKHKQFILRIGFDPLNATDSDNAYLRWHRAIPGVFPEESRNAMLERTGTNRLIKQQLAQLSPSSA